MATSKKFEKLLEPGYIGPVKTRNRMVKTGAAMLYWYEDDVTVVSRMMAFYEALAKGGVGLLIVESPTIDFPFGRRWQQRYRIDDDKYINGLKELVQVIHRHGCPTFMQMNHDGPWQTMWGPKPIVPGAPIASSPVTISSPMDFHNEMPRQLSIEEIKQLVDKFASAAVRAGKAGFDGIDINAGSSHLLHNFLSPFWNRRQDEYGGNRENRARFLTEIVHEIKNRLGKDFPVSVCINGIEVGKVMGIPDDKCITAADSMETARLLQRAGADAIHVRSHWLGRHTSSFLTESLFYPEPPVPLDTFPAAYDTSHWGAGANLRLASGFKKELTIPVMTVGRLGPELGESALREGKADFIGMTRRLLADPELPNKIMSGRLDDIAPCTACTTCIDAGHIKRCRINAALGTDDLWIHPKVEKKKKVLVVGGGPAGMEAARVAALMGHEVTLCEKSSYLGGSLSLAAFIKGLEIEDIPAIIRYLKGQVTKLGVQIKLGVAVDEAFVREMKPDTVILAMGGVPVTPDIPGINNRRVMKAADLHRRVKLYLNTFGPGFMNRLMKIWMPIGKNVIIIGGAIQGCELAEFLTKRGRKVTIVDTGEIRGEGMIHHLQQQLFYWFEKKGVVLMSGVKLEKITEEGLVLTDKEGKNQLIKADTIIPALPLSPNLVLMDRLKQIIPEVYAIGDCRQPQLIVDAIADGARTAHNI
jgi:2,4-dienoyl-CoA reductase (NADPH2)